MFFDMDYDAMIGGLMTYPDYPFTDLPVQPSAIKETIIITGSQSNPLNITGTLDQSE